MSSFTSRLSTLLRPLSPLFRAAHERSSLSRVTLSAPQLRAPTSHIMSVALHTTLISALCVSTFGTTRAYAQESAEAKEASATKALAQASRSKLLEQQSRDVEKLWARLNELMRSYTEHKIKQEQAPKEEQEAWVSWFLSGEESRLKELQSITSELLSELKNSKAQQLKKRYFRLKDDIDAARLESIKLAEDSYLAPSEGEAWFYQTSKADYQELIKAKKEAIQELKKEQQELIQGCHDHLVAMGIELTEGQVRQLFQMKSGEATFDLLVTFSHLNLLLELLTERMNPHSQGEAYAQEAERYYAVYVALIGLSVDIHKLTRQRLEREDLREIDQMGSYLRDLIKETRHHLQSEVRQQQNQSDNIIKSYQENLKTQQEVLKDSKEYRALLISQLKSLEAVERDLERQWNLALNTYNTARVSNSYYGIVNRGLRDLNNLRHLKLPSMIPLMSERLSTKLDRLESYRARAIELNPKR